MSTENPDGAPPILPLADLFLVGVPKAGTTSIATWLGAHPEIYWSVPKEPHYWSSDFPDMRAHYGFADRSSYEQIFSDPAAGAARWRGDGSTTYLYSQSAIPDILSAVPQARFVIGVRRYDELIPSYHRTQLLALNETEPDVEAAWRRAMRGEGPATRPLDSKLVDYPTIGAMGAAVARAASLIPAAQLHIVVFDDLRDTPRETFDRLLAFLEVGPGGDADLDVRNAGDKAARFDWARKITHRPPAWLAPTMSRVRQWSRTTEAPIVQRLKALAWREEERATVSAAFQAELRDYYAADLLQLETVLGRRLDQWRAPV